MSDLPPNKSNIRHIVFFLFAGCLLCGLLQRWTGLERTPEYDELYTLHLFALQSYWNILLDVATPNNHTLNTWCIKSLLPYFQGREVLALRLGAFLGGIGGLLLALYAYWKILPFRKHFSGGFFFALIAFNGALIHYAGTGRGYSLQSFFVAGAAFSLLFMLKKRLSFSQRIWGGILFLLCSMGAILSVSTGILFITGLALGALFLLFWQYKNGKEDWKTFFLQRWPLWGTGGIFAILSLSYYLPLAKEFMKGTGFGGRLDLSLATLGSMGILIWENDLLIPFIFIILAFLFARKNGKWMVFFLIGGCFPYLSGFIFRAGPPRVYVPAIPLILAAGALGAGALMEKWRKNPFLKGVVPILLALAFFYTSPRILDKARGDDLGVTFAQIKEKVPGNFYPLFMPTESFALEMLYGRNALEELSPRLDRMEGIILAGRSVGAATLDNGATNVFPIPEKISPQQTFTLGGKVKWNLFLLEKLKKEVKEYDFIFLLGRNIRPGEIYPLTGKELQVNFRQNPLRNENGTFLLLIPGKDFPYPLAHLRQWENASNERVVFLALKEE